MKLEPITIEEVILLGDNLTLVEYYDFPDRLRWCFKIYEGGYYYKSELAEEWCKGSYTNLDSFILNWGIGEYLLFLVLDEEGEPNET